ncbi:MULTISPECIES: hypothetical protein [unclassified Bradyrhizobium]|uniref:hypothetical protein n=1 Tax=unclassified Bradyrhizobium TaxID=2631580 RepID=UPI00291649A0|nr:MULTISPECIES: hypothetical protein [unclassified Bradyrhizobium]
MARINSHNEWDKLREVIVGRAEGACGTITWKAPGSAPPERLEEAVAIAQAASPQWFNDEVCEDLEYLSSVLIAHGVVVRRPTLFDFQSIYSTPFWSSSSTNLYNARDLNLVVGNTVIESPSYSRSRYFETIGYYDIWYEYLAEGFKWIAAPKPMLNYDAKVGAEGAGGGGGLTEDEKERRLSSGRLRPVSTLVEREIVFEAATTLRMGRDLLFLVSSSGNRLALKWLQSILGDEFRVHGTEGIYRGGHIDSTVLALRPGQVLLNSARVNEDNCPSIFSKWDKLYFEDVTPIPDMELRFQREVREPAAAKLEALGFDTNLRKMSSPWIGMNILSLDQNTIVVDKEQSQLIRFLEGHKYTVVPVPMRHMYTQCGGIHCVTLDTVRESKLESYFD